MHRITPPLDPPAHLPPRLPLLQIRKLPQMMHSVQIPDLHEPRAHALHHLLPRFETLAPVRFPLEEVAGVEGVGTEFEEAAELAGWGGGPKGEFLHEGGVFGGYEAFKLVVEGRKFRVGGDAVEGGVISLVALVFPYVHYIPIISSLAKPSQGSRG